MNKIILGITLVVAIGLVGWFYWGQLHPSIQNSAVSNSSSTIPNSSQPIVVASTTDTVYLPYCYNDLPLGESGSLVSPGKIYSATLYVDQSGATNVDYDLDIVKLNGSSSTIYVKTPPISTPGYKDGAGATVIDVISSYDWNDDNSLDITSYVVYVGGDDTSPYHRVSPVEVWRYNLSSGTYAFIKDLPEPATPTACLND